MPAQRYDSIGLGYTSHRRPDPRIAAQIWAAVGDARRVVNIGAGAGSYEVIDRAMVAVEPSEVMLQQRPADAVPVVRAVAEHLPFPDRSFDVALALMTVHHWRDLQRGVSEMRRVASRQVIFTFDESMNDALWIFTEYVPAASAFASEAPFTSVLEALSPARVEIVPVPADCQDGFASAYWRRPEMYVYPEVRTTISAFARLSDRDVAPGIAKLEQDLASGEWQARHGDLADLPEKDFGLRLIVSE